MLFRPQQEDTLCPQRQYALHPDIPKFPSASKRRTARLSPKSCHKAGKGENTLQYKNATSGRQTPYCPAEDRQLANLLPHRIPKAQTQWDGKSRYKPCQNNDAERASAANSQRPGFPCHIPPAAGAAYKEEWQNLPAFFPRGKARRRSGGKLPYPADRQATVRLPAWFPVPAADVSGRDAKYPKEDSDNRVSNDTAFRKTIAGENTCSADN